MPRLFVVVLKYGAFSDRLVGPFEDDANRAEQFGREQTDPKRRRAKKFEIYELHSPEEDEFKY